MIRTGLAMLLLTLSGAAAMAAPAALVAASPMPLAAHHATYRLSLLRSTGNKAPGAVDGVLTYDFSGSACDGYAMALRQMTALQPQEGDTRISDMQTASFEAGDSRDYRFTVASKSDNTGAGTVDGTAHRDASGKVSVRLAKPAVESLPLPEGVLFPTEHLKRVIAAAEAGQKLLSAAVFDGSETGKKVFNTLSVIGAVASGEVSDKSSQQPAMKDARRWPVTISYFDAGKGEAPPEYVLSFELYENGVSRALKLDYGDFVLAGELTGLELKPERACAR